MSQSVTAGNSLRNAFGQSLLKCADEGMSFTCGDGDVQGGTGLSIFAQKYRDRVIQFGISEQSGIGISSGMALATGEPFVLCLFAAFAARGWEIFRLSTVYNKANLKLVLSHVGPANVGPDGHSAASGEHYALWRTLGIPVIHPADSVEMEQAVHWMLDYTGPCVLFTGRSPTPRVVPDSYRFGLGKASVVYPIWRGEDLFPRSFDVTLIACGHTVAPCIEAAETLGNGYGIKCRVANMSSLYPVDVARLAHLQDTSRLLVTVEDHSITGGLYGAVCEALAPYRYATRIIPIGINGPGQSGEAPELTAHYGIDAAGIARKVLEVL